ncbi:hypothetical protein L218DRAFT_1080361 [Marasmius fiardii PR-910]|nr:hypothetical protein L218DRAFT_1080361 [Marasmius fiardii PR-910]
MIVGSYSKHSQPSGRTIPPKMYPQQANHNTNFNRVYGDQTNNHYGDITQTSDPYNTTTTNNYGPDDPMVNNSDNNNLQNDRLEASDRHGRGSLASEQRPSGYPLLKSTASHSIKSGPEDDLTRWQQSHPPPLPPQKPHLHSTPYLQYYLPHCSSNQASLEGYPHNPLPTPDILGLMRRNQTIYTYQNQIIEQGEKEYTVYKKYTMISYRGDNAKELWEQDFQQFAEQGDAKRMQLYGINCHSSVPFLIFHSELIPVAQIQEGIQDTEGLYPESWFTSHLSVTTLPSNLTFLQKDVFWQYLLQLPKIRLEFAIQHQIDICALSYYKWVQPHIFPFTIHCHFYLTLSYSTS